MTAQTTRATILGAAVNLARRKGLNNVTRLDVAHDAEIGTGTVNYHFDTMDALRGAIVDYAIENEVIEILVQARALKDPRLGRISQALKDRVASAIVE